MKLNGLFEDVFMDIDWSLYDDETADLSGLEKKIYRTANKAAAKWRPKTREKLVEAIEEELKNGNTDLNCIDTSEIIDMSELFDQEDGIHLSVKQQQTLDVSDWDVSNVENMYSMFSGCENFTGKGLENWNINNVKTLSHSFTNCKKFNADISQWDVSAVSNFRRAFAGCTKLDQDLSKWDLSSMVFCNAIFKDTAMKTVNMPTKLLRHKYI